VGVIREKKGESSAKGRNGRPCDFLIQAIHSQKTRKGDDKKISSVCHQKSERGTKKEEVYRSGEIAKNKALP